MMTMNKHFLLALAILMAACSANAVAPQSNTATRLTIEQLVDIRHPSNPAWSPDGRRVLFTSERAGVPNLFVADVALGNAARAVTAYQDAQVGNAFWARDSQTIYFARGGDLWQVNVGSGEPRAVWTTPAPESSITASTDCMRVAFVRPSDTQGTAGLDLWIRTLSDGTEKKIAHDADSISALSWAPDGAHLTFSAGSKSVHHDEAPVYSGAKIIYTVTERTPSQTFAVPTTGGKPIAFGPPGGFGAARWLDARRVVFDRQSADFKKRTIYVGDVTTGAVRTAYEDVDEKFWSIPPQADPAGLPSPDGKWIAFVSDRDGWDHLYVVPADGGAAVQITKGAFEVWRPSWSPDSTRLAFDANQPGRPGTRHIGIATLSPDPGHATVESITADRGTNIAAVWSPDGKQLIYQHTNPHNSADLFLTGAGAAARATKAVRVSDSMPATIDRSTFVEPELVHYAGPDGQQVPAWLFMPKNLDRTRKHPAVVWIHGDGINQNYDGWHVQRNYAVYYSFHQYLLQKGYVVLAPDYRGSIGYGRAWRQGVYMNVGGKDAKDAWMGANYLRTLGYVDMDRVGVWGLSYGGFFTLIAVTDQPKLYRAAVDVAGVVDYAMYYNDPYHGGWTASRIGTPEQNPQIYAQASPLSHVDRLERPLLVLHGTSDINVPYLHSVRLIDELLKKGKGGLLSFMVYPGEFHYFTREHVLKDAWRRVERFFDEYLGGGSSPRTSS
jgi:dipeptidyl aminopeptidase/acylaminoacyl peptidase